MKSAVLAMLLNYLAGHISRDQLEDWLILETWDSGRIDDPDTLRIVRRIKLRLVEFLNGDWTEDELRETLSTLIDRPSIYRLTVSGHVSRGIEITTRSTGAAIPVRRRHAVA